MKNVVYFFLFTGLSIIKPLNSQCVIENQNFENWNNIPVKDDKNNFYKNYESPGDMDETWVSYMDASNIEIYNMTGDPSYVDTFQVFKSTDAHGGNYALGLQYNSPTDNGQIYYIAPCNGVAKQLEGFLKFTGGSLDSVDIQISYFKGSFQDNNPPIAFGGEDFGVTNGWQHFSVDLVPMAWGSADSVIIFISMNSQSYTFSDPKVLIDDLVLTSSPNETAESVHHDLNLYPNPTEGISYMNIPQGENYLVNVSDITGKLIHSTTLSQGNNVLDLSSFEKGLYFVQLTSNHSVKTTSLLVK